MALSAWQHAAPQEDARATSTRAGAGSSWIQIGAKSFLGKHSWLHIRNSALRHVLGPVEGSVQLGGSCLGQPHVVTHLPFGESENPALLKSVAVWLSQQLAVLKNISLCKLGACWRCPPALSLHWSCKNEARAPHCHDLSQRRSIWGDRPMIPL